jgi:hypothetical protein
MRLSQRIEEFFFPCSKRIREVKGLHAAAMQDLRMATDRLHCILDDGKVQFCVVEVMDDKRKAS